MKLSILIDSVLIVTSIALLPGIGDGQTTSNNSGKPVAINSNNLPTSSTKVSDLKPIHAVFIAHQGGKASVSH
ncbi:hypothetical protein [Nostoc sp.]|uniref:hypothetical protein n=1 Tax=Nostoc sp. TaxID=1180 RepID=UPI002FF68033